jgi:hypothetical protein
MKFNLKLAYRKLDLKELIDTVNQYESIKKNRDLTGDELEGFNASSSEFKRRCILADYI